MVSAARASTPHFSLRQLESSAEPIHDKGVPPASEHTPTPNTYAHPHYLSCSHSRQGAPPAMMSTHTHSHTHAHTFPRSRQREQPPSTAPSQLRFAPAHGKQARRASRWYASARRPAGSLPAAFPPPDRFMAAAAAVVVAAAATAAATAAAAAGICVECGAAKVGSRCRVPLLRERVTLHQGHLARARDKHVVSRLHASRAVQQSRVGFFTRVSRVARRCAS